MSSALWRRETYETFRLAWPMIVAQLAQMALPTTDILLLGGLGPEAVASGALAVNLYNTFMLFGVGIMSATVPMVARQRGHMRHSVKDLRRTVQQALWVAVSIALPMWAVLWNGEAIFHLLGQDPELSRRGAAFLRIMMWGLLPFFGFVALRSFIAALERPAWTLIVGVSAVPINAVLGWALIHGRFGLPTLGANGAAFATALTMGFLFAGLVVVLVTERRFRRYRLFGDLFRADWQRWRDVWRLGLPIALMIVFETSIFNAAGFLVGLIGTAPLAAHAVTLQIAATAFMVPFGLAQAVTVRVGLAYGRGDDRAMALAGWTSWWLTVAIMCGTAALFTLAPDLLLGAFLDRADPKNAETLALGRAYLAVAALFQIVDGIQATAAGMLRGRHDTRVPMIMALAGYWGVGLTGSIVLAFPLGLEGVGVWLGLALGLGAVAILLTLRWIVLSRRPSPLSTPAAR
ncbi:MATE family efflux transporter [Pinisolibacter sp.]|uniref:MATE family efflux transporter n=1 Tax=Pinisolibacter sp. TaxID=2172024 RepID=UPI002FDCBF68